MKTAFVFFLAILSCHISSAQREKKYLGAEVRTFETFKYGKFEVRMRSCKGSGVVSSFFTFYDEPDFPQNWNEIDVEMLGRYDHEVQFNTIIGRHNMKEHRQTLDFNPHEDFHVYGFEWYPDSIVWFVDGVRVYAQSGDRIKKMNQPQKIMMNVWPPNIWAWSGVWDESILPVCAAYDYVKYSAYTPEKDEIFTHRWTEQFKDLDYGKWQKATHTFKENNAEFIPDNAVIQDGYLGSAEKLKFNICKKPALSARQAGFLLSSFQIRLSDPELC
ncbi:family 16 glycosylhydrolase [Cytophagaceae bacterium ABcell3]|nr:family 16 glycosylhydrolase [Cytophagaceae bacterium ABcell3]